MLTSILTGVISSFLFYLIFEYIPSIKQGNMVINLMIESYNQAKTSILFEFAKIQPHHTAYELIIIHPQTSIPIDFNDVKNLHNYLLLRDCFKEETDKIHSKSEYASPYAINIIKNLCRVFDFALSQKIILSDASLTKRVIIMRNTLLEFAEDGDWGAYKIIQYFLFGGTFGIWTTPQLHRFMRSEFDNEGDDNFINILERKLINFC